MSFTIDIRFLGGLTPSQQITFAEASARWSELIVGELPRVELANGEIVENLRIDAQAVNIDGASGILGQAGPTQLRAGSFLPATGMMQFDTADLARLEAEDSLENVIIHEMGHVLGFGTLWSASLLNLIVGEGSENPEFTGTNAIREYNALRQEENSVNVPVANTGGQGTRDGHWREITFDNELMTGFINNGTNPISRLSVGAFQDMGYQVDYSKADEYKLPQSSIFQQVRELNENNQCRMCSSRILRCDPIILPKTAFID